MRHVRQWQDIKLSATASNWRLFSVRKADPAFLSFEQKIFERDHYTCQFCGFQAKQFQEVINLDGDFRHNKMRNLVTACRFCAQCFFLESIGKTDFGSGTLIYLPEMSQVELNALCHVLFAKMVMNLQGALDARNIYRSLKLRSQSVEKHIGEGYSQPALYGHMLVELHDDQVSQLHSKLCESLRVLPSLPHFATLVRILAQHAVGDLYRI